MSCPPEPGFAAVLLAVAAKLAWRSEGRKDATGRELGSLFSSEGRPLHLVMVAGTSPGSCTWALVETPERPAMAFLLSEQTFASLQSSEPSADGSLLVQGAALRLRAGWDGVADLATSACG